MKKGKNWNDKQRTRKAFKANGDKTFNGKK